MEQQGNIRPREALPDTRFGWLENGALQTATSHQLFRDKRVIIVGIPGAFTPVCSRTHIPQFVEMAPSLLRSGFSKIVVVANHLIVERISVERSIAEVTCTGAQACHAYA